MGLVEGITEYLPVSSTGHLIITASLLGLDRGPHKGAVDAFTIVIQGGAILAVLLLYWPRILWMVRGTLKNDHAGRRLLINLIVAFLPAAVLGVLFSELIETHLFRPAPVLAALFLGGVWMIWLDRRNTKRTSLGHGSPLMGLEALSWKQALGIGLFQCVAMWPGTSRSMMTIAGGALLGLKPRDAAEFSFLLGLPTLGGACVYKLSKNMMAARETGTPNMFEDLGVASVLIGMGVATVAAIVAVRWLVSFLNRHGLAPFGWYRIGLCIVMGGLIAAGIVRFGPNGEGEAGPHAPSITSIE